VDPDECLKEIRRLLADHASHGLEFYEMDDLTEKVEALDEWLVRGGFLPFVWKNAKPR